MGGQVSIGKTSIVRKSSIVYNTVCNFLSYGFRIERFGRKFASSSHFHLRYVETRRVLPKQSKSELGETLSARYEM